MHQAAADAVAAAPGRLVFADGKQPGANARHIQQALAQQCGVVVAGHLGVGVGHVGGHAPVGVDLPGHIQLQAPALHLARRNAEVGVGGAAREHIGLADIEQRHARVQALVGRLPLGAQLQRLALLRVERLAAFIGACVGTERAPGRCVDRGVGVDQVGQPDARRGGRMRLLLAGGGQAVFAVLVKAVKAHARQQLPFFGQVDLVLHKYARGAGAVHQVKTRREVAHGLVVDRVVDVDGKRLAGQAGVADVLRRSEPPGLHTCQHGVAEAARLQLAFDFALQRCIARWQAAPAVAARQGTAVGGQGAGQVHGGAIQVRLAVRRTHAGSPALAQVVVQRHLVCVAVDMQVLAAGVAQVAVGRQRAHVAPHLHDAPVQRGADADELRLVVQHGVGAQVPGEGRGHHHLAVVHQRGTARAVLGRHVQAVGNVGAQRAGGVERGTAVAMPAHLHTRLVRGSELRLFGDDVERAARLAAAIQRGRRAFEKFNALDRAHVALRAIAPVGGKAVEQLAAVGVAEATDRIVVPGAAKVVQAGDAAHIVHGVGQARGAQVFHQLLGHHAHGLRGFDQRRVGACGCGVALRALVAGGGAAVTHLHFRQGGAGGDGVGR